MAHPTYQRVPSSLNTEYLHFLFTSLSERGCVVATSRFLLVFHNFLFSLVPHIYCRFSVSMISCFCSGRWAFVPLQSTLDGDEEHESPPSL